MTRSTCAVLGLGERGRAEVRRLLAEGHTVCTYDEAITTPMPGTAGHYQYLPHLFLDHYVDQAIDTTRSGALVACVPRNVPCRRL